MSGTVWTKFYWSDWDTDPALRLCSYGAQGLWMRLLCIAAAHDPIGYVAVAGRGLSETDIARMTGGSECEVSSLLGELERNGVFSRDRQGRIYSRRMITDARASATARKNGKSGGNPSLRKDRGNSDWDKGSDKGGLKPQEPEAISQKPLKPPLGLEAQATQDTSAKPLSAWVAEIWDAAPQTGRGRSGRAAVEKALKAAIARRIDPARILSGLIGYYASPDATKNGGEFAAGIHVAIGQGRWEAFADSDPGSGPGAPVPPPDPWPGRLLAFQRNGYWNTTDWGPKPGKLGCRAPGIGQEEPHETAA